ncbi:hypothetical protein KsCSTR_10580 [Candidatus Kuenenia stuttgartiensis]|uniref:Uncharacterized protein n=1 Tax=Kuenenia stuttgartiensis TaxID=174633 RepID=Q1PYP6_KUEST|nr:hypothetical protein KsCSTR_10580 [Candidatus Kuenenia stuttgartiensis]CAJ72203.1 unknown protein [Candidatus Kuenenia stuttgartiensis]
MQQSYRDFKHGGCFFQHLVTNQLRMHYTLLPDLNAQFFYIAFSIISVVKCSQCRPNFRGNLRGGF